MKAILKLLRSVPHPVELCGASGIAENFSTTAEQRRGFNRTGSDRSKMNKLKLNSRRLAVNGKRLATVCYLVSGYRERFTQCLHNPAVHLKGSHK